MAVLGCLTAGTIVFGAIFMACVPSRMRKSFHERRTWKEHMAEFWWKQQVPFA